ncbi:MAG: ABC transporter substrate-binding protein [Kofleriaceae bacterium]
MIPDPGSGRMLRAFAIVACIACAVTSFVDLGGCADPRPSAAGKRRIVSIGGAITETVFALGAGDDVVAVDTSSVYPEATAGLPKVGYQRTLSAEGILALAPDLVIVSDEAGPPATLAQLRAAGVRVAQMPSAKTTEAAIARVVTVGKAIGRPTADHAAQMTRDIAAARARVAVAGPRFVLVYARGAGTLMVAGSDTAGAAMVALAGGRNAVAGLTGFKPLSPEILIDAAPDVIVVPVRGLATLGGEHGLLAVPGVAETPAGRQRRIVAFDDLLLLGFGPRLATAIDGLARALRVEVATPR